MKKIVVILTLVALICSLVVTTIPAAADNSPKLVYKVALVDHEMNPDITGSGEVKIWENGECQIKLEIEEEIAGTYPVLMDYGPPTEGKWVLLGTITTDSHGKANEYYNLSLFTPLDVSDMHPGPKDPYKPQNPGFLIGGVAVTGFSIPASTVTPLFSKNGTLPFDFDYSDVVGNVKATVVNRNGLTLLLRVELVEGESNQNGYDVFVVYQIGEPPTNNPFVENTFTDIFDTNEEGYGSVVLEIPLEPPLNSETVHVYVGITPEGSEFDYATFIPAVPLR